MRGTLLKPYTVSQGARRSARSLFPFRKRIDAAVARIADQIGHAAAARHQLFEHGLERGGVLGQPFGRNLLLGRIHYFLGKVHHAIEPRLKVRPIHARFDRRWGGSRGPAAANRETSNAGRRTRSRGPSCVRRTRSRRGFACRGGPLAQSRAEENGLPGVGVAHPFVESQHAQELARH